FSSTIVHRPLKLTLFPYTTLFRSLIDYRRIEKAQPVDIAVAMVQKVITNYRVPISFYQEQSVSDEYTSRKERAAFYQGDERISKDRKSTRLNSSHVSISYAVFCLK